MKIISNQKIIKRNKLISQGVLYLSIALLVIGFLWSFTNPDLAQTTLSYIILIPAFLLVQVSIFMANKWGRSPRPDEIIERALKGLNDQYTLYNYTTSTPHLLLGPAGIWIIKPYHHSGEISYNPEKNRFEQHGGPNIIAKLFAQESLPNIKNESSVQVKKTKDFLHNLEARELPEISVVNIFFSEKADVHAKNAPEITVHVDKLKDIIRKKAKAINIKDVVLNQIKEKLPQIDN